MECRGVCRIVPRGRTGLRFRPPQQRHWPGRCAGLSDQVQVINLLHPMAQPAEGVRRLTTLRCGIPARLYQFKLGGLLDRLVAAYYGLLLAFVVPRGSRVVARSYFSALVVTMLQRVKSVDLVFDTRSQFVQENVSAGRLQAGSAAHRCWLAIELTLLQRASKVLAVSEPQAPLGYPGGFPCQSNGSHKNVLPLKRITNSYFYT